MVLSDAVPKYAHALFDLKTGPQRVLSRQVNVIKLNMALSADAYILLLGYTLNLP